MKPVRWLGATVASVLACGLGAPAASAWQPQAPTYGVGSQTNLPVSAADGTILRTNVYFPTDKSGKAAPGPFPVILTQTPYGKDNGPFASSLGAGENDYLSAPFTIGRNTWYLTAGRSVRGALKVRHGVIEEVGIADGRLLTGRRAARRFLTSFR